MAKRIYKQPSIVSGKSIKDILNMDISEINKLGLKDLRLVVGRLVSAVNKRLRRFEKAGINSPAVRSLKDSGGKLSVKDKNLNQLRDEFSRGKNFLEMETSTRAGYDTTMKKIQDELHTRGVDIEYNDLEKVFEIYNDLKKASPQIANRNLRYIVLSDIEEQVMQGGNKDDIITSIMGNIDNVYKEVQGREVSLHGVSGFFEIGEGI